MASTRKSLRSSTASKRPTTAIADGQIALNTNAASPGLFFKDSTGATIIKVGPVHVGTTAPNATPAAGGSSGNSTGEVWLDTSLTPVGVKIWDGSAWVNATPTGTTSVAGLLALASNAETQTGTNATKAVTPAGLQSKVSDSTSTTSSTTIASSTAVKAAYDLANAALPKAGGTVTGALEIGATGSLVFEGATADEFETTLGVVDPTANRTINLPDVNGTVITTGDNGTVTSTMIANGTIVDADINASAEIAVSKLADGAARQLLQTDAAGTGVEWTSNIAIPGTAAATSFSPTGSSVPTNGFYLPTTNTVAVATNGAQRLLIDSSGQIESAGLGTAAAPAWSFVSDPNTGIYSPGADQLALSTNGTGRLFVNASGNVGVGVSAGLDSLLQINGQLKAGSSLYPIRINTTSNIGIIEFPNTATAATLRTLGATPLTVEVDSQERLRITSAGLVGIGTSSPGTKLEVFNTGTYGTAFQPSIYITNSSSGGTISANTGLGAITWATDSNATLVASIEAIRQNPSTGAASALAFRTGSSGGGTERLRITSAGNVGIGTTSPSELLTIADGNLHIRDTVTTSSTREIRFARSGTRYAYIGCEIGSSAGGAPHQLTFGTNNAGATPLERARIDSSGRLLVGTSTSATGALLEVNGRITGRATNSAQETFTTTSANAVVLTNTVATGAGVIVYVFSGSSTSTAQAPGVYLIGRETTGASVSTLVAHPSLTSFTCDGSTGQITITPNTANTRVWKIAFARVYD